VHGPLDRRENVAPIVLKGALRTPEAPVAVPLSGVAGDHCVPLGMTATPAAGGGTLIEMGPTVVTDRLEKSVADAGTGADRGHERFVDKACE